MLDDRISRAASVVCGAAALLLMSGAVWSDTSQAEIDFSEQTSDGVRTAVRVRYDDLDLSREEGIRALYSRLDTAARRACGYYDMRNQRERQAWRSCRETALAEAVLRTGLDNLAELAQRPRGRAIGPRIEPETRAAAR